MVSAIGDFAETASERIKKRKRGHHVELVSVPSQPGHPSTGAEQDNSPTNDDNIDVVTTRRRSSRNSGGVNTSDTTFVAQVKTILQNDLAIRQKDIGYYQSRRMLRILQLALPADSAEAPFLSNEEARRWLTINEHDRPVFVKNQQTIACMSVQQMLREFYDDEASVMVQDPSRMDVHAGTYAVDIAKVKERLNHNLDPTNPWNCLELAAPIEDGTRPLFLNDEDFRLLTKLKVPTSRSAVKTAELGRKFYEHGYKEVEKWALIAQAGALTLPHQDSHGYSTYITVNDGVIGFGWLHRPTEAQRQAWLKAPTTFLEGDWRYRVLRPGDTVYFPAGQVHFVFRHRNAGHTLAFGGHVLRCSTIVSWVKTMKEQLDNALITNEEWNSSANGYLRQVAIFVEQALDSSDASRIALWGGVESIREFLELKDKLEKCTLVRAKQVGRGRGQGKRVPG